MAGTFDLAVSDTLPADLPHTKIKKGQSCELRLAGQLVFKGWVEDRLPRYDSESHSVRVAGRDLACDLVDCSAVHASGSWSNQTLAAIVRDVISPYKLKVVEAQKSPEVFQRVAIQEGEKVWELLDRLCKQRGVLVWSDGLGGVILGRPKPVRVDTTLTYGGLIEEGSQESSDRDRYSSYTVKGHSLFGDPETVGPLASQDPNKITDLEITRYRPLVIVSDTPTTPEERLQRARLERDRRRARAKKAVYIVPGWTHSAGLWRPNLLVPVDDLRLDLKGEFLVGAVKYLKDEDKGSRTELSLYPPDAFDVPKEKPKWSDPF